LFTRENNMNRSLLPRLPDIVSLARLRAHELVAAATSSRQAATAHRRWPAAYPDPPGHGPCQRISLLCGDDTGAMLGLLTGTGRHPPMAGHIPLVWLNEDPRTPADADGVPTTALQREIRRLLDLTTRLFLVRHLLCPQGTLAATLRETPERGIEHLLHAVFGEARPEPAAPRVGLRTFLAGAAAAAPTAIDTPASSSLLGELVRRCSQPGDAVLVLNASVQHTAWVGSLERRWIFVHPDAMRLALLREHVVERQRAAGARLQSEASDERVVRS
jgi:hypothetical protein